VRQVVIDEKIRYFTTGQVADHCGVNFRTVIRWINKGYIKANRLPGRGDHRITLEDFIVFLRENNLEPIASSANQHPKALVIDDELNVLNSIGRIFNSNGFEVTTAQSGFRAGYLLNEQKPQIITLDLNMKDIDGHDVLKIIKDLNLNRKTWIVVISGEAEHQLKKAVELGADFYLQKPFTKFDLEKIIHKLFPNNFQNDLIEKQLPKKAS
jgi:two-component system response regulator VicR